MDGSANGASQYTETHSATTSQLRLFNLAIGGGTLVSGNFSTITWASGDKSLKIEMDATGGNNFSLVGTSQLLSVPYALNAGNGSQWKSNSSGIYYDDGNVGIGLPSNSVNNSKLAVKGNITSSSDALGGAALIANGLQTDASYILLRGHKDSLANITSSWSIHRAGADKNKLVFRYGESEVNPVYMTIDSLGKVGIGTTNPQRKLDVKGDANVSGRLDVNVSG